MPRPYASRRLLGLLRWSSALPWVFHCVAAEPPGAPPSMQGPRIMLYVSQALNGGSANRLYGLRLERSALPPLEPGASAAVPFRQRELVNLHFAAGEDLRIEFGRRLSWDFGRKEFSLASIPTLRPIPVRAAAAVEACAARCAAGAQPH